MENIKGKEMDTKIRVVVRCRPLVVEESRSRKCIQMNPHDMTMMVGDKKFSFEQIFDEESTQEQVYESCVQSLVEGCFQGFNGTVFAYGQTGSGKTYSIMGNNIGGEEEDTGIIPRALEHVFQILNQHLLEGKTMANIRVSMIEIYNDECRDLLHPEIPARDVMIREDKHGRIFFTGAREEVVSNARTAIQFLQFGAVNRTTAETLMNQTSSRSHAIFTISLEMIEYSKEGEIINVEDGSFIHAKLHLVDLAGSERAKRTGASGTRFKESVGINQGLLSLGKVIRALTSNPITHVPYRESKLTRFLQDSLGGNSRTVLLACISPSEFNLHETINTLHYAQRAKSIHNKISANVTTGVVSSDLQADLESSLVVSLRAELVKMQKEMATMVTQQQQQQLLDPITTTPQSDYELDSLQANSKIFPQQHGDVHHQQQIKNISKNYKYLTQIIHSLHDILTPTTKFSDRIIQEFEKQQKAASSTPQYSSEYKIATACQLAVETLSKTIQQLDLNNPHNHLARYSSDKNLLRASLNKESFQKLQLIQEGYGIAGNQNEENYDDNDDETNPKRRIEQQNQFIQQLQKELLDCQEDLKRDEEIFSEKIKELKKLRKQYKELEMEYQSNQKHLKKFQKYFHKLHLLSKSQDFRQSKTGTSAITTSRPKTNAGNGKEGFPTTVGEVEREGSGPTSNEDDLDISIAVAMTEPDISQLIEDIESLMKEKEDLFYQTQQLELEMKEMRKKEQQQQSGLHLETENQQLVKQLQSQEKKNETIYQQLTEREELIQSLQAQLKQSFAPSPASNHHLPPPPSSSSTGTTSQTRNEEEIRKSIHNEYLSKFQALNQVLEQKEATFQQTEKEKQTLKKKLDQISHLKENITKENDQLLEEKQNLQEKLNQIQSKLQDLEQTQIEKSKKERQYEEDFNLLDYSIASQLNIQLFPTQEDLITFLDKEMNELIEIGNKQVEITKLNQQLLVIEEEKESILKELHYLENKQLNYSNLWKNYGNMEEKIKQLKLKKSNLKNKIQSLLTPSRGESGKGNTDNVESSSNNIQSFKKELQEIEFNLSSYQSYQQEMKDRMKEILQDTNSGEQGKQSQLGIDDEDGNVNPSTKLNPEQLTIRIQELQDDLETLDTEKSSVQERLINEKQELMQTFESFQKKQSSSAATSTRKNNKKEKLSTDNSEAVNTTTSFEKTLEILVEKMKDYSYQKLSSSTISSIPPHQLSLSLQHYLLRIALQYILQLRINTKSSDQQMQQTKELFHQKANEYDELIMMITKLKTDFQEQKSQMKKEHEEKIVFLLQQMKLLETKHFYQSMNPPSSSSSSRPGTAGGAAIHPFTNTTASGITHNNSPFVLNRLNEAERKQFEDFLLELNLSSRDGTSGGSGSGGGGVGGSMNPQMMYMNHEIFKRYLSEKERREILEKRNSELIKELKGYRNNNNHYQTKTNT